METVYLGFSIRVWIYAGDPDDDVHTAGGSYADVGEVFQNTTNGKLFICKASSGSNSQTWDDYFGGFPQADWSQSNSSALDYIKNKPDARSQSSASRSLNSGFQVSTTRDCFANYSVDIATSLTLTTGQAGTVYLEIASDSGFTSNLQELARFVNGNTGTLTIGIALSQNVTGTLSGYIPSGYYARLRTENNTSTPTFTYISGQEVLL